MIVRRNKYFSDDEKEKGNNKKDLKSIGVGLGVSVGALTGLKKT